MTENADLGQVAGNEPDLDADLFDEEGWDENFETETSRVPRTARASSRRSTKPAEAAAPSPPVTGPRRFRKASVSDGRIGLVAGVGLLVALPVTLGIMSELRTSPLALVGLARGDGSTTGLSLPFVLGLVATIALAVGAGFAFALWTRRASRRHAEDHISDINMPYSSISREYLLAEGIPPDRIIKTGSPMYEVLHHYMPKINLSPVLGQFGLEEQTYFLVSAHREENIDAPEQLTRLLEILNGLAEQFGRQLIISTHPRTRNRLEAEGAQLHPLVQLMKPMGFCDYVKLQMHAYCVLSDSGTITEESSILNFPALNIRNAHERPEGFEEGAVILTGVDLPTVLQALELLKSQPRGDCRLLRIVEDYRVPNVSEKVARIIISYTGYVKRVIWRER